MITSKQKEAKGPISYSFSLSSGDNGGLSSRIYEISVRHLPRYSAVALACCLSTLYLAGCSQQVPSNELLPDGAAEIARSIQQHDGKSFTSIKYELPDKSQGEVIIDEKGKAVDQIVVPARDRIGPRLGELLAYPKDHERYIAPGDSFEVVVVLVDKVIPYDGPVSVIEVKIGEKGEEKILIDGKPASIKTLQELETKRRDAASMSRKTLLRERQLRMQRLIEQAGWKDDAAIQAAKDGLTSLRRKLTRGELQTLLKNNAELILSIELYEPDFDELNSAMDATNIQDWAIDRGHDGSGAGIYMREANGAACPSAASMNTGLYTNLSSTGSSNHANHVGNIIATVSPEAHVYCGTTDFMTSPGSYTPRPWVANHSWGSGTDTAYKARDRDFDNGIYDDDWAVFKSAGNINDSNPDGNVTSPGKAFNIITVANYIDSNTTMSATSCYVDPDTNTDKPDLAAPGEVNTSVGLCTGTSCAAPHAAAFAADLIGEYTWLEAQPARVKALMMAGATDNIEGSVRYSDKDGAGGIEYLNSGYNGVNTVWWGSNGSHFNANNRVTVNRTFTAGQHYRVALVWLVSGTFAYSPSSYHIHNYYINMDLDLKIIDPSGQTIAWSSSWDNAFEIVDFIAPSTGTYTVEIHRYANSGVGKVNMAIHSQKVL